jgi:hypothetical protein
MASTDIMVYEGDASLLSIGFEAAVANGLLGLWFFNRGLESRRNLAIGGVDASVIGAPSNQGAFLRFKGGANFFQTDVSDSEAFSIIAAVKSTDTMADPAHSPMFVSNFGSGSVGGGNAGTAGASIYSASNPTIMKSTASRYADGTNTAVSSASRDLAATLASWNLVAARARADRTQADNLTSGAAAANNYTTQARVVGAGKFRIGGSFSADWTGTADVAAVALYNRFITDSELISLTAQFRTALAHLGISV